MKRVIHTHYDNLRIKRNATQGIIKAAYRALSYEYHPDRNPDRDTTRIMQMLNDAYAVLSDPVARAKYDAHVAAQEAAEADDDQTSDASANRQVKQDEGPAKQVRNATARPTWTVYALIGGLVLLFVAVLILLALW